MNAKIFSTGSAVDTTGAGRMIPLWAVGHTFHSHPNNFPHPPRPRMPARGAEGPPRGRSSTYEHRDKRSTLT